MLLYSNVCLVVLGTDVVFIVKSGRSNCIVFFEPTDVVIVGMSQALLRCFSIFDLFAQVCLVVFKQV